MSQNRKEVLMKLDAWYPSDYSISSKSLKEVHSYRNNSVFWRISECHAPCLQYFQYLFFGVFIRCVLNQLPQVVHKGFRCHLIMNEMTTIFTTGLNDLVK